MSIKQDYSRQLWGFLPLGREVYIRRVAWDGQSKSARGVVVDMQTRSFGANKPSSFLLVPTDKYTSLASDYSGAAPRYFQAACEAVGQRFESAIMGFPFEKEGSAIYLTGPDAMVHESGLPVSFYQGEHEALALSLRPGARARHRHSPSVLRESYVKRVRLYPARRPDGVIAMKTELALNLRKGPAVARDEVPPFEHLVYS